MAFTNKHKGLILMHWSEIETNWNQFERMFNYKWNMLTKDEVHQINGSKKTLNSKLKEHYGLNQVEADGQISKFLETFQGILKGTVTVSQKQGKIKIADLQDDSFT